MERDEKLTIEETLQRIEEKLAKIETDIAQIRRQVLETDVKNSKSLFGLPDHLRKTALGLMKIGQGTANDVSKHTRRARAVESDYLNQLERQGFVTSFRKSREKFFSIGNDLRTSLDASEI